jgi:hypothetical protein
VGKKQQENAANKASLSHTFQRNRKQKKLPPKITKKKKERRSRKKNTQIKKDNVWVVG